MCYRTQLTKKLGPLEIRYAADALDQPELDLGPEINGFAHPATPVILDSDPGKIRCDHHWGLVPAWSRDDQIRKNTLNARIESLSEKPAFRDSVAKRCLVPVTAFYEWHWNDAGGKSKQKFEIHSGEQEIFSLAGIYASWQHPITREVLHSYAVLTTEANPTMRYIHNSKRRMPVVLRQADEQAFLRHELDLAALEFPRYDPELIAFAV